MTHKSEDYKISAVKYYLKNITPQHLGQIIRENKRSKNMINN